MMKTSTLTAIICLLSMALFAQRGAGYRAFLKALFAVMSEQEMHLFYEPSEQLAMDLMKANDRDDLTGQLSNHFIGDLKRLAALAL